MSDLGVEIHRCYDEYGPIRVFENGALRYLAFGEAAEQSCMNLHFPSTLVFEYTQAMMLTLLYFPKPKRVTFLGLGAGSLVHALHHYDQTIEINVVELREKVVEVAQEWFALEPFPELTLTIGDAALYIANIHPLSDVIFADIYNDEGMIEAQLSSSFLLDCYQNLSDDGILVLNLWDEGGGSHPIAIQAVRDLFGGHHCMTCLIEEGNLIAYAFKSGVPESNVRRLQPMVKKLAKKMDVPVHKLLSRIKIV
jgi:spermidine synthase